jgi:hypothetical protein
MAAYAVLGRETQSEVVDYRKTCSQLEATKFCSLPMQRCSQILVYDGSFHGIQTGRDITFCCGSALSKIASLFLGSASQLHSGPSGESLH